MVPLVQLRGDMVILLLQLQGDMVILLLLRRGLLATQEVVALVQWLGGTNYQLWMSKEEDLQMIT